MAPHGLGLDGHGQFLTMSYGTISRISSKDLSHQSYDDDGFEAISIVSRSFSSFHSCLAFLSKIFCLLSPYMI